MPNRDIKESCRTSRSLSHLSHGGERMFWRLVTVADDFGRFDARPVVIRALCFPVMLDKVKEKDIAAWLGECEEAEIIQLYEVEGKPYGYFVNWGKYQRVRNKISKFPDPLGADPPRTLFYQRAIPVELRREVLARDGYCLACEGTADLVVDHIVPVALGGTAAPENLQTLCRDCNGAKHAKTMDFRNPDEIALQFAATRRGLRQVAASPVVTEEPGNTETTVSRSPSAFAPAPLPQGGSRVVRFTIPESVRQALDHCPILGGVSKLRDALWWQAQVRAHAARGLDFAAEVLKAEAWITTNPQRAPKKDYARFLHTWLNRAEERLHA